MPTFFFPFFSLLEACQLFQLLGLAGWDLCCGVKLTRLWRLTGWHFVVAARVDFFVLECQ